MSSSFTERASSTRDSRVSIKVKVLLDGERRPGNGCHYGVAMVIDSKSLTVKETSMPVQHLQDFKAEKFPLLQNVVVGEDIRMYADSKVLQCSRFCTPEAVEHEFYNPPEVSVSEAVSSAKKRRVTIKGELVDISPVWTSGASVRKEIKIKSNRNTIKVKLWDQKASLQTPPIGQIIEVSCVQIVEFKGTKDANSTVLTEIRDVGETQKFSGTIDAVCFHQGDTSILILDEVEEWPLTSDLLDVIFPSHEFEEGVEVQGTRRGREIISISRIEGQRLVPS